MSGQFLHFVRRIRRHDASALSIFAFYLDEIDYNKNSDSK